jgi:hypothetical protein
MMQSVSDRAAIWSGFVAEQEFQNGACPNAYRAAGWSCTPTPFGFRPRFHHGFGGFLGW